MLVICVICRNETASWKDVSTGKMGTPTIGVKDLLIKCLESPDLLPDSIQEKPSNICFKCEKKLLEFYQAVLQVDIKRNEFKKLVVANNPIKIEKLEAADESIHFGQSGSDTSDDDIWADDWDKLCEVETKIDNDESDEEGQVPIAVLKAKLLDTKASRFCSECQVECPSEEVLELHIKKVHKQVLPQNPFICKTCEKTFKTYSQLTAHAAVHLEPPLFARLKNSMQCDECGHIFNSKSHLNKHKIIHTNVRNYKCTECDKSFRQSSHLSRHKLTHSGVKPHICLICNRTFALKYNLRSHMRLMHAKTTDSKEGHLNAAQKTPKQDAEDLGCVENNSTNSISFHVEAVEQLETISLGDQFNTFS